MPTSSEKDIFPLSSLVQVSTSLATQILEVICVFGVVKPILVNKSQVHSNVPVYSAQSCKVLQENIIALWGKCAN